MKNLEDPTRIMTCALNERLQGHCKQPVLFKGAHIARALAPKAKIQGTQ